MTFDHDQLRGAIDAMVGEVTRVVPCDDGIDVVVIACPAMEGDDGGFFCATLGLSNQIDDLAELIIHIDGAFSDEQMDATAADLARVTREIVARGWRLDDVFPFEWSQFPGMAAALLTEYMFFGPDYLWQIEPKVRLLGVHPLHRQEAGWIAMVGAVKATDRFRATGSSWFDPTRAPVTAR